MMTEQTIPVVDLEDFLRGTPAQRDNFIQTLGDALCDLGFFALENHQVDAALIERCYQTVAQFFALDEPMKAQYIDPNGMGQRGYTAFGTEHAKDHDAPDLKEFWHVGQELPQGHPLLQVYGRNIWPQNNEAFKAQLLDLFKALEFCADSLLRALALYLDEPEGLFADMIVEGDTILRAIHYPPIPPEKNPASVRAAAHEDVNLITILCESTAPGLELLQRDNQWRPIHALKGQFVVDSGDMLQHISNGRLKSTTHRVTNPDNSRERRFSMPFFVHPRPEVDLTPLAKSVAASGGRAKYDSLTAREFLEKRLEEIGLKRR